MGILAWIIFGGICGWVASILVGSKRNGCITNIIIGIIGSVLGGIVFELLGHSGVTGFNVYSIIVGVVGSIILLAIVNLASRD